MQRISPLANTGFRILEASMEPLLVAPAPTMVWISSMNNIALGLFFSSAMTPFSHCSKSQRNLVPASIPPRSNAKISTSFSSSGMSPL